MKRLVLLSLLFAACSTPRDEDVQSSSVQASPVGSWVAQAGDNCLSLLSISDAGAYVLVLSCDRGYDWGSLGTHEEGTVTVSGDLLHFVPSRATCKAARKPHDESWSMANGVLVVGALQYGTDFQGWKAHGNTLYVGCFDDAGTFYPSTLE